MFVPSKMFLIRGVGVHPSRLNSFRLALRKAGIAQFSRVQVSGVFPPHCKIIPRSQGMKELFDGHIVHCVFSENASNEPNRSITASVGAAVPRDRSRYGYLSEHHGFGQTEKQAGDFVENVAVDMLATGLGLELDADNDYDAKTDTWRLNGLIVKTQNITQSAAVDKSGDWKTVIAGAVLLP